MGKAQPTLSLPFHTDKRFLVEYMIERFFRDLTDKGLRRGAFRNVNELVEAIEGYIEEHNTHPKPFIWTATAADILEKVKRGRAKLNKVQTA